MFSHTGQDKLFPGYVPNKRSREAEEGILLLFQDRVILQVGISATLCRPDGLPGFSDFCVSFCVYRYLSEK